LAGENVRFGGKNKPHKKKRSSERSVNPEMLSPGGHLIIFIFKIISAQKSR
jgi:hypothetical protein